MHIPDGVLSPEVCAVTGAISLGAVGYSLHKLKDSLADRTVPLTGMMAALVFAGQMVNFPLIGTPVSGHLMGGVLAAAIVGPWAGCLAITLVLVVQCALFADGGLFALGANVLHMAVVGSMGGYAVYAAIRRLLGGGQRGTVAGVVIASWLSVMAAALLFCIEFRLSWLAEDYNFANIFTLMVTLHSVIGVGEALITGTAIGFVLSQRPELLYRPATEGGLIAGVGRTMAAGTVTAMAVAAFLAPLASEFPDGLEAVAARAQFEDLEVSRVLLLNDYSIPLPVAGWQGVSVALAGLLGTAAVLAMALLLGRLLKFRPQVSEAGRIE
jgi:cobalt/nickel transport system permease protein